MPQTLVEKIAQRFAVGLTDGQEVHAGDFLSIRPAHVMTHDNTSAVIPKFESMGAVKVADAGQPVFALDHDIQNTSPENLAKYAQIEAFAKKHGIAFHPAGRGIGHQVMIEEGFVLPGAFVVASDSHSNIYGAMGTLGTPVVRTDAAAIWATGRTWWQVPDVVRVTLHGRLQPGTTGKDVIIALCGVFNHDEVLNCCIEFTGPGVAALSMEQRLTISNMTTEWGALAGLFPYDPVTQEYLVGRAKAMSNRGDAKPRLTSDMIEAIDGDAPHADAGAFYAKDLTLDLAAVTPHVSGPNTVKTMISVAEVQQRGVRIDKAYLMSCVNGRLQDFAEAAEAIRGRRVADGVKLYIAAASDEVERQAKDLGYWQTLIDAGAIAFPPGCGACIGLGDGLLEAGEVGISATNRNFKGRMGSRDASVYLAGPAVVAASAVAGKIAAPADKAAPRAADAQRAESEPRASARLSDADALGQSATCRVNSRPTAGAANVTILPGFPERVEGELLLVPQDNLNTDGIYSKDYTYKELPPAEMAAVAMANYDPAFQQIARQNDILVGGYNFGSGSSREQAATALKHRGLQMVIAGSFSQTYKRNAFNNGYICIECPALVDALRETHADHKTPTIRAACRATIDFTKSAITLASVAEKDNAPMGDGEPQGESEPRASARADAPAERTPTGTDCPRGLKPVARSYAFSPLGEIAQELIVKGGFEAVIAEQLRQ